MRFFDKLNTPKAFVIALALVVAVNALIFFAHNYRLTENTATASPATATEPEGVTASSADATPTENSEGDDPSKPEEAGAKETAGAATSPDSKNASGPVSRRIAAQQAAPQPPSGSDPSAPPVLNQQNYYPAQEVGKGSTEPPTTPAAYPEPVYGSNGANESPAEP